jgi:predicted DNA-binding transcriptional regulator AlpA
VADYDPLLRKQRILQLTGVTAATLHGWIRRGTFPMPLVLNAGSKRELVAWPESVFLAWRNSLPERMATPVRTTPYAKGVPTGPRKKKKEPKTRPPRIARPE